MPKLYFEDVEVGGEIPALVKRPTTKQLVNWSVATQDPARIHYDKDRAQIMKLPGTVVHGLLKCQWFVQMLTLWIGDDGDLKKVACRFHGMDLPGDTVTCRGRVKKKYVADGQGCVECELCLGNEREEKTTLGTATVVIPQRE
jgi:acyl dehydratase